MDLLRVPKTVQLISEDRSRSDTMELEFISIVKETELGRNQAKFDNNMQLIQRLVTNEWMNWKEILNVAGAGYMQKKMII